MSTGDWQRRYKNQLIREHGFTPEEAEDYLLKVEYLDYNEVPEIAADKEVWECDDS